MAGWCRASIGSCWFGPRGRVTCPVIFANNNARERLTETDHFQSMAQQAKELLDEAAANVVGVVLNKRQYPVPRWLYRAI